MTFHQEDGIWWAEAELSDETAYATADTLRETSAELYEGISDVLAAGDVTVHEQLPEGWSSYPGVTGAYFHTEKALAVAATSADRADTRLTSVAA